jgi:hypothetical protein
MIGLSLALTMLVTNAAVLAGQVQHAAPLGTHVQLSIATTISVYQRPL